MNYDTERDEMFETAIQIVKTVRLHSADVESAWARQVCDHCHVWGDFYGPATSPYLARAIAHRYLDRQGGELAHLKAALLRFGTPNRNQAIVDLATRLVKEHCELERMAAALGTDASVTVRQQDQVIAIHIELERTVLGSEAVPGRRSTVEHSIAQPVGTLAGGHGRSTK